MGETPTFVLVKRTMFPMQTLKTDTPHKRRNACNEDGKAQKVSKNLFHSQCEFSHFSSFFLLVGKYYLC